MDKANPAGKTPQPSITPELRARQEQTQTMSLSRTAGFSLRVLAMNAAALTDFLKREADRNPCVELTFPQAGREDLLEELVAARTDYREELLLQLPGDLKADVLSIARALIGELDEFGYLPFDPMKRCPENRRQQTQAALRLVQSLEPAGVGARSLRECYWIQANRCGRPGDDVKALLLNAALFRLYAGGSLAEVCERLGWARARLDAVSAVLAAFAMRPVEPEADASVYVTPDAEIVRGEDGAFKVRLLEHALPHVTLSAAYVESLEGGGGRFVNEGLFYANRLLNCLERRNATLLNVLQFAAERQGAYLNGGTRARLPLSDAAKALGLNRSTVSRAVAGKYVLCENRVFAANTLFTRAGKEGFSRESACALIAALLEENSAGRLPSDRELSEELLTRYNLRLARRTVNLYRSKLARPAERNRV